MVLFPFEYTGASSGVQPSLALAAGKAVVTVMGLPATNWFCTACPCPSVYWFNTEKMSYVPLALAMSVTKRFSTDG